MLEDFETLRMARDGVALHVRRAGQGAPLLLLHGHPQTHGMWHRVAPQLAQRFCVVLMDLRGYGDSDRPAAGAASAAYAKREMAHDALHVMRELGHTPQVLAHDRGARVAHRRAGHAGSVQRMLLLDTGRRCRLPQHHRDFARASGTGFLSSRRRGRRR